MKAKNIEKEMEKTTDKMMREFKTLITLCEAYDECASLKRQKRFTKKMEKKYAKTIEKLEERIDNIDFGF